MENKRASNIEVKKINRNQIFRYVNKYGRVSKPDITLALGISMPTVLQNINELIEQNLVREVGLFDSTGGRKAIAIAPIHESHYAIGIDITQNHIGLVLTDLSGEVLRHTRVYKPFMNDKSYYKELGTKALQFMEDGNISKDVFLGFGISVPGIVDPQSKKITFSHALGISNVTCDVFQQFIPYPCIFINDANASGIAEIYNAEKGYNAVYLSLSNSVGGAIIEERQSYLNQNTIYDMLYLGDNWRSGEFGHVALIPGGKQCYCGKQGCFDSYCSAKNLSKYTNGKLEDFFMELEAGNEEFKTTWEEYINYLAIKVNSLRMTFDCRVIIGGYVGSFIEPYISDLREKAAMLNTFETDASYIQPCKYRIEASALGSALLYIEEFIRSI